MTPCCRLIAWPLALMAIIALWPAGCATLEELAPPVNQAMLSDNGDGAAPKHQLELGREIYITDCARCHSPEPVRRYSVHQWRSILPRMAEESKLSNDDCAAIEAYVIAVLQSQSR